MSDTSHAEREDHPWAIRIPDHPQRADSPTYLISRRLMNAMVKEATGVVPDFFLGGAKAYQDHHGGGL